MSTPTKKPTDTPAEVTDAAAAKASSPAVTPASPPANEVAEPAEPADDDASAAVPYPSQADLDAMREGTFKPRRDMSAGRARRYETR